MQYNIHDDRNHDAWEGTDKKNQNLLMTGEIVKNAGRIRYVERLYDEGKGGIQVFEIIESCSFTTKNNSEARSLFNDSAPSQIQNLQGPQNIPAIQPPPVAPPPTHQAPAIQNQPDHKATNAPLQRDTQASPATSATPAQGSTAASNDTSLAPLALVSTALILIVFFRNRIDRKRKFKIEQAVNTTIKQHKRALVRKRFQTLRHDDYGNLIADQWLKEINYFMDKVVAPVIFSLGSKEVKTYATMRSALVIQVANVIESEKSAETFTLGPNLTPTDYEKYCAQQLISAGWMANTTKASGDQGTDIIAIKGHIRLVVQCKLYSQPVGNKAVQEVAAARTHEQADFAAVVTNSRYTYSAQQLATTNQVLLLHHSDLTHIDELISEP